MDTRTRISCDAAQAAQAWKDQSLKKGSGQRYFSLKGGMTLALKRCLSNGSTYTLGITMGLDVSPPTIRRWEIKLRAARIAAMRAWHRGMYERLHEPFDEPSHSPAPLRMDRYRT